MSEWSVVADDVLVQVKEGRALGRWEKKWWVGGRRSGKREGGK